MNELHPGDQLDHYRIEALVTRGGMASVFRATDQNTGRQVAIKVPHPQMECDVVFFDRFQREAEIGQALDHPGVIKVLADKDRSRPYMAMEWVEGRLLREVLKDTPKLPCERAVKIALGICDALAYIHGHGVVHRDLKPDNIMVLADDRIKIIDFGIALSAAGRRLTFGKLSQTMGTPDYISPEQIKGKRGDARSDLYALGIMLYEMLAGKVPFEGSNPFAAMNERLLHDAPLPSEAEVGIPHALREIISRALEREPTNRYASAQEFAWDLSHPEQLADTHRIEQRGQARRSKPQGPLFYLMVAMIPIIIIAFLLYVAKHA